MLTETDPRVRASVNLHAVFGALPLLVDIVPEARALLTSVAKPVVVRIVVAGGDATSLVFRPDGVSVGDAPGAVRATLRCRDVAHLNAVVAGTAQPLPIAGIAGLRFLAKVFTPLVALLGRYLAPSETDLAREAFADASRMLLLDVAANAIVVVANEDRSGRFSAAQMSDGDLDIAAGPDIVYRLRIRDHRLTRVPVSNAPSRAAFRFIDLQTAGDVLAGRESPLVCAGDGRIALSGYIPLVDNANRILDRVGHYLGD